MNVTVERYRRVAIASLAALFVVIVAGAAVRSTNSGLGCDDWPNCNETSFVDVSSKHAAIEQVNRLFNGVVTVAVTLVAVLAHRLRPRRRDVVVLAWWLVALVAANAVLGGISVRVGLHPIAIQFHLLLALAALVVNLVLIERLDPVERTRSLSATPARLAWAVAIGTAAAIVAGTLVTGAGPHAGDEEAPRLGLDIPSVARIHGVIVAVTLSIALALAWSVRRQPSGTDRRQLSEAVSVWLSVGILQAVIGYVQYFNDLPELLVGAHVAGAAGLTLATTHLMLRTWSCQARPPSTY